MKTTILSKQFFDKNPVEVCQKLLGKFLVIKKNNQIFKYIITEIEAYDGQEDEACHARFGKTSRTAPMFNIPGCWYVYLVYGMYNMLNIVTGPGNHPSAILIRTIESAAAKNDGMTGKNKSLVPHTKSLVSVLNGPGKLTKALGIDKRFNGKIANKETGLRIEDSGINIPKSKIITSPRIGIDYAGDEWKNKPWRFYINFKK